MPSKSTGQKTKTDEKRSWRAGDPDPPTDGYGWHRYTRGVRVDPVIAKRHKVTCGKVAHLYLLLGSYASADGKVEVGQAALAESMQLRGSDPSRIVRRCIDTLKDQGVLVGKRRAGIDPRTGENFTNLYRLVYVAKTNPFLPSDRTPEGPVADRTPEGPVDEGATGHIEGSDRTYEADRPDISGVPTGHLDVRQTHSKNALSERSFSNGAGKNPDGSSPQETTPVRQDNANGSHAALDSPRAPDIATSGRSEEPDWPEILARVPRGRLGLYLGPVELCKLGFRFERGVVVGWPSWYIGDVPEQVPA